MGSSSGLSGRMDKPRQREASEVSLVKTNQ